MRRWWKWSPWLCCVNNMCWEWSGSLTSQSQSSSSSSSSSLLLVLRVPSAFISACGCGVITGFFLFRGQRELFISAHMPLSKMTRVPRSRL